MKKIIRKKVISNTIYVFFILSILPLFSLVTNVCAEPPQYQYYEGKAPQSYVVFFPDSALEAAIRLEIDNPTEEIHLSQLLEITSLDARFLGISDLTGLEYCKNLETLYLYGNQISSISQLSELTNLWGLDLHQNQIVDISPLSGLTKLEHLSLQLNQIVDISPLSGLTKLFHLYLNHNQIDNIIALSNLENLQILTLNVNQIEDISPLLYCLDDGDAVDISSNQLNEEAPDIIAQLISNGVFVNF